MADTQYAQALKGEGEYWDTFIAERLLHGEVPGSIDWRLAFSQFRYNHNWRPFCIGMPAVNFRLREMKYVITQATRGKPGARVLDLGCGTGWLSLELARRGAHVTGLDVSATNLKLARYMAETNERNFPFLYQNFLGMPLNLRDFGSIDYQYADLNNVSLPREEYDAVVVWDSLHHVASLERLFEEVRGALKPEGVFLGVDHSYGTQRTDEFNRITLAWLDDLYAWISAEDPEWLYDLVSTTAERYDWGVLSVDYDPTPVPGFGPFLEGLLADLRDITTRNLHLETPDALDEPRHSVKESPFEDVSAKRIMLSLLDNFEVERFQTLCPFVMPEKCIPAYRSEKERIFQHYLAAGLVLMGERAIKRDHADGQWFLFHMTPQRTAQTGAFVPRMGDTDPVYIARREDYLAFLESEIARKNEALISLEERIRQREAELVEARRPRLPWKRWRRNG
jgi:2-polyprenyl-3-methyl-5-hydroxy-6-metoxy-1,4-benzoquinol methylase